MDEKMIEKLAEEARSKPFRPSFFFNPTVDLLHCYWSDELCFCRRQGDRIFTEIGDKSGDVVGVKLWGVKQAALERMTFWERVRLLFGPY